MKQMEVRIEINQQLERQTKLLKFEMRTFYTYIFSATCISTIGLASIRWPLALQIIFYGLWSFTIFLLVFLADRAAKRADKYANNLNTLSLLKGSVEPLSAEHVAAELHRVRVQLRAPTVDNLKKHM